MKRVWRIATDTPDYESDDLSGKGAETTGGRWNRPGLAIVYAADNIALACLETLVHLGSVGLPLNRFLVEISIPGDVMNNARVETTASLPVGWTAEPVGRTSLDVGEVWLNSKASAILVVPSVIAPEETNILINPKHPDATRITARKIRPWTYDSRLIQPTHPTRAARPRRPSKSPPRST